MTLITKSAIPRPWIREWVPMIKIMLGILLGITLIASGRTTQVVAQKTNTANLPLVQATVQVRGRVTGPGAIPLAAIKVTVYDAVAYQRLGEGLTASDGSYNIDITPTPYKLIKVRVNHGFANGPDNDDYVTKWYPNADYFSGATAITLPDGGPVTNMDVSLEQGGAIGGQITFSGIGTAPDGVGVNIYAADGSYRSGTVTDTGGQFLVKGLRPGQYALQFGSSAEQRIIGQKVWYQGQSALSEANLVTVTNEQTTDVSVTLDTAGYIAGTVTDENTGNPLPAVSVRVYDQNDQAVGFGATDPSGQYTVGALATGSYKVQFSKSDYRSEYYDNQSTLAGATLVSVTAKQTTANVDAALIFDPPTPDPRGTVAGTITKDGGQPLSPPDSVEIRLDNVSGTGDHSYFTYSSPFTNTFVRPGTYKVFFDGGTLRDEWYQDQLSEATADTIVVTEGTTITLTADLASNRGCIAGTLRSDTGLPIEGVSIVGIREADSPYSGYVLATDSNGQFNSCDSGHLVEGDYVISFIVSPYVPEWYNDIYYGGGDPSQANVATVAANETATVDATLDLGGCISGKVIDEGTNLRHLFTSITVKDVTGSPVFFYRMDDRDLASIYITGGVTAQGGGPTHHTDVNGEFVVCGLPTGSFILQGSEAGQQTYPEPVDVTVGEETSSIVLIFPGMLETYLPLIFKN